MSDSLKFAAVQNGVILDVYDNYDDAVHRCKTEIRRDFASIMIRRKLRRLFAKSGNVALHVYSVLTISKVEVIDE